MALLTPLLKNLEEEGSFLEEMLDRVFSSNQEVDVAKRFVRAYIEVAPEYERITLLAALMAASEKRADGRPLRIGEGLKTLAENLGDPAFVKVCQAIHSNPTTPPDIRADLGTMKGMANVPSRRELFALFDLRLPVETRNEITSLGRVLGAGSYWIIVEATMKNGERVALGLLRDKAEARAADGFSRLEGTIHRFVEMNSTAGHYVAHVGLQAIRQARGMVKDETNTELGAQQVALAHTLYDGTAVRVDRANFRTWTADWNSWGTGYKIMQLAEGTPFNDLQDEQLRRGAAKAYLAIELSNLISGERFDHDRHGNQLIIDEKSGTLWVIDTGAMRLDPLVEKDKEHIGNYLFKVYEGLQRKSDLGSVAVEALQAFGEDGPSKIVAEVQRALLALADFYRELRGDDFKDVIRAALRRGQTDPVVQQTFIDRFVDRYGFLGVMGVLVSNAGPSFSTVKIEKKH